MPRLAPLALLAAAVAAISPPIARAEPPATLPAAAREASQRPALTVRDALSLAAALRNLDGRAVVIRQNGQDGTVMVPWEFGSGSLRIRIANDLAALAPVERAAEASRQAIAQEVFRDTPADKPDPARVEEFQRQYSQVLDTPAAGLGDLARISVSELKLDKNEIAVTVLQALKPILDQ
jgi:hypothetical protein